ncbi:MAG: glycosyltransferase family 9 protein [Micropepsaceae bacterium]
MKLTTSHSGSPALGRSIAFVGGGIGDVIMHTGHFQAIARASTDGRVSIGCRTAGPIIDLLQGNDFVDTVIGFGDGADRNRVVISTAVSKLKVGHFDSFFCLKSNPRLITAAWLAGIPKRFGYMQAMDPRAVFLTTRVVVPKVTAHPLHMSKADRLLTEIGLPFDHADARLKPKPAALAQARSLVSGKSVIAIGVNASVPERQWGERFIPLIKTLDRLTGAQFVLFGGSDVRDVAARIRAGSGLPATRFVDLTELGATLALSHAVLSLCQIYVGNDSSGLNLAVFCGIPAVGFFSLAPPLTYSPLIIPISPLPAGTGVDGIGLDRVVTTTIDAINRYCPRILTKSS